VSNSLTPNSPEGNNTIRESSVGTDNNSDNVKFLKVGDEVGDKS
jgi:hypothetical protein